MGFSKGESGNLKGRPKITEEFKEALKKSNMKALETVLEIMQNKKARDFDRLTAAKYVLDKSLGINFVLFEDVENEDREMVVRIVKASKKDEK